MLYKYCYYYYMTTYMLSHTHTHIHAHTHTHTHTHTEQIKRSGNFLCPDFIQQVVTQTAVVLDPVYSGKAALAMVRELQNNAAAFKGRRVLFLHTGTSCCSVPQPNTVGHLVYAIAVVVFPGQTLWVTWYMQQLLL